MIVRIVQQNSTKQRNYKFSGPNLFLVEICYFMCYQILSQQLSGAAMVRRWIAVVSVHPPASNMRPSVRFL